MVMKTNRGVTFLRSLILWVVAIGVALGAAKGVQHLRDGDAPPVASDAPAIDGVELSTDAPSLVYFWATWCGVCRAQTPVIESVRTSLAASPSCGRVVALEDAGHAEAFEAYGVRVLPTMVVVDAEGRVAKRFLGYTTKWQILAAMKAAGGTC